VQAVHPGEKKPTSARRSSIPRVTGRPATLVAVNSPTGAPTGSAASPSPPLPVRQGRQLGGVLA
jgi:hypothetical protein